MIDSNFPKFNHSQRLKVEQLCPDRPVHKPSLRVFIPLGLSWLAAVAILIYVAVGFFTIYNPRH